MFDELLSANQVYGIWLAGVTWVGIMVFLRLTGKEWAYRDAWLRADAERRAEKARLEARIARNRRVVEELTQAGEFADAGHRSAPTIYPDRAVRPNPHEAAA